MFLSSICINKILGGTILWNHSAGFNSLNKRGGNYLLEEAKKKEKERILFEFDSGHIVSPPFLPLVSLFYCSLI